MFNALRFVRYTFRALFHAEPRHRHQKGFWKRYGTDLLAGFGGALVVSMPVWMILMGVI